MNNLQEVLGTGLINQEYTGHRPVLWNEQTAVQITMPPQAPKPPEQEYMPMYEQPKTGLDEIREQLRGQLYERLRNGTVRVSFTKADGSATQMDCTLNVELIPHTQGAVRPADPDLFVVYSLDRGGWRSFKYDRVTLIKIL
jgi:hypothetical protein